MGSTAKMVALIAAATLTACGQSPAENEGSPVAVTSTPATGTETAKTTPAATPAVLAATPAVLVATPAPVPPAPVVLPELHTTEIATLTREFVTFTGAIELDESGKLSPERRKELMDKLAGVSQAFKGRVGTKDDNWWMDFSEARQEFVFALDQVEGLPDGEAKAAAMAKLQEAAAAMDKLVEANPDE